LSLYIIHYRKEKSKVLCPTMASLPDEHVEGGLSYHEDLVSNAF